MRYAKSLAVLLALGFLFVPQQSWSARPVPCPDLLFPGGVCAPDVGAAVAACCPCDSPQFSNHGRYVRCVAHAANALRRADCLDRDARRSMRRCAARSTCNKPHDFRTCCFELDGVCEADGFCAKTGDTIACTPETAADVCPSRIKCTLKRDEQHCLDAGGTPGTGSCCDAVCGGN